MTGLGLTVVKSCSWVEPEGIGWGECNNQLDRYPSPEWIFFCHLMTVHAVKDQLNTPPSCDGARQNLLNIEQLHCHNTISNEAVDRTKIQNITRLLQSFLSICVIVMSLLSSLGKRCNLFRTTVLGAESDLPSSQRLKQPLQPCITYLDMHKPLTVKMQTSLRVSVKYL